MNGVGTRKHSTASSYDSRSAGGTPIRPSAKAMLNGYDPTQPSAYHGSHRGTMKDEHNGSNSQMLDVHDPVTMHLLMENALGDSQRYGVLSVEEAEELKRELPRLEDRMDARKRQLAIETKVRDAATNLSKLDKSARRGTGSRGADKSEEEIVAANKKCEDLASELWQLTRRHQDVERQLLEHTAGVLTRTHKGYLQNDAPPQQNGLDGYKDINSLDLSGSSHFDDQSFYQALDSMLTVSVNSGGSAAFEEHTEAIQETERKLWNFNHKLRDVIAQATSGRSNIPGPPNPAEDGRYFDSALQDQVSYLENGFVQMQRSYDETLQSFKSSSQRLEEKMGGLSTRLRGIVVSSSLDHNLQSPLPPEVSGRGPEEQVSFLDSALEALEHNVFRLKEVHQSLSSKSGGQEEMAARFESMLQGLWSSMSDGEKYSEDAFASKVSSLATRIGDLTTQKDILKRQIEQQREINSLSDGEKDSKITLMNAELEQVRQSADQARAETESVRKEMGDVEGEIVRLQTELTVARAELDGAYGTRAQRAAEVAQHPALQQEIADLRQELEGARFKASESEHLQQLAQTLRKELSETITDYEAVTKASIEFEKEREALESATDSLRDRCEVLETQLSEEKVSKLGFKTPGAPGDRVSSEKGMTSTSVLKTEFKKMMRETRQENMRALRHEQDERRKLEAQVRELKKGQTPGKSSLSQSTSAS